MAKNELATLPTESDIAPSHSDNDPPVHFHDIGPAFAARLLEGNGRNRVRRDSKVRRLAAAMREGRWKPYTGQVVCLDNAGNVLDGQHTLSAIISSGCTVRMLVQEKTDPNVFRVKDNHAPRSGADTIYTEGIAEGWLATTSASACNIAHSLMCNALPYSVRLENDQLAEFALLNPQILASVSFMADIPRHGVPLPHAPGAALHFMMCRRDVEQADTFMRRLFTGEELAPTDMLLALRQKLIAHRMQRDGNGKSAITTDLSAVIRVWNSQRAGRTISYISNAFRSSSERWPEIE